MSEATLPKTIEVFDRLMQSAGGEPREWYVGVSADATARLQHHAMRVGPQSHWIACENEAAAREIEQELLQRGVQPDNGTPPSDTPATQVYVFRAPHLTRFRDWLQAEEERKPDEKSRREKREEWVAAVTRFIEQCYAWLWVADPNGFLNLITKISTLAERQLGRYEVPELTIEHETSRVHISAVALTTLLRTFTTPSGQVVPALGRVDIVGPGGRTILYRTKEDGIDRWYRREDEVYEELNQNTFMAIMEDQLT